MTPSTMPETEPISKTIREFIESIAKKAKETKPQDRTQKKIELQAEIKTQLNNAENLKTSDPTGIASEKHDSKVFSDELESNTENKRRRAQDKAQGKGYKEMGQDEAALILDATKGALSETNKKAPDWVEIDSIQHDPATARFAVTMALLPTELQTPEVILKEVSRLYYSDNRWTRLSPEAFKERHNMVNRALEQVRVVRPTMTEDKFYNVIDRRYELYRARRIEPIPDSQKAGDTSSLPKKTAKGKESEIDKTTKEYGEWAEKKTREVQRHWLEETLTYYQERLDAPEAANPKVQKDILDDLLNKLDNGVINSGTYEDASGNKLTINNKFNRIDQEQYVKQVQDRKTRVNEHLEAEKQKEFDLKKQTEEQRRQDDRLQQEIQDGQVVIWTQGMADLYKIKDYKVGDIFTIHNNRGYFTQQDLKEIFGGIEGQKRWLADFREKNLNQATQFKPDLDTQSELGAFKRIIETLWAEERPSMSQVTKNNIELFEEIDSVTFAIRARPSGDKVEEVVNILKFFSPKAIETILETDYIEIAYPQTGEALEYVLQVDMARKDQALNDLLNHEVPNPFKQGEMITENELLRTYEKKLYNSRGLLEEHQFDRLTELLEKQRLSPDSLSKDELTDLGNLQKETGRDANNPLGGLNERDYEDYLRLQKKVDVVGRGILLRDYHMNANQRKHGELRSLQMEYSNIDSRLHNTEGQSLSDAEKRILERQKTDIEGKFNAAFEEYSHGYSQAIKVTDVHNLEAVANLSPVDMVARERTIDALMRDGKDINGNIIDKQWVIDNEWKIYEAVVAARNMALGTGQTMEIAAKKAQSSSLELKFMLGRSDNPKYFMERMFAEAYCRVLNDQLFEDDFHMRGPMGDDIRNTYYKNAFEQAGYKLIDVMSNKAPENAPNDEFNKWIKRRDLFIKNGAPEWVLIAEYAKDVMGLGYSEIVRPDLLYTGLTVSSSWRYTNMGLDELAKAFTKDKGEFGGVTPDFEALGLRFNAAPEREKSFFLELLKKRKISAFINNMGGDLKEVVSRNTGIDVLSDEFKTFSRSLSISEMQLWKDKNYRFKNFDFGNRQDFDGIMTKSIKAVTGIAATQEQLDKYFNILQNVREHMDGRGANGKTRLENWAKHKFEFNTVLTRSDFNVKDFDYTKINAFSLQRRINDYKGQAKAGEIKREILVNHPEKYFYPAPGKEVEAVTMIDEYKNAINSYSGIEGAEMAGMVMLDTMVEWNYNFMNKRLAGAIPGLVTAISWLPSIRDGKEALKEGLFTIMERTKSGKRFVEDYQLRHKNPSEWPNRMSELVSKDLKWSKGAGNKWDEFRVAGIFKAVDELKMATTSDAHNYFRKMQSKYHSTLGWRFLWAIPRKYWWAVPVATIALALMASAEDEKKSHH